MAGLQADSPMPAAQTLTELLSATTMRFATRPALRFFGRITTYGDLATEVDRVAHGLASLGVTIGDRIALLLPNTPTFAVYFFAAQRLGAVVVNLNPLQDVEALDQQIRDVGARVVVTLDLAALFDKADVVLASQPDIQLVVGSFAALLPSAKSVIYRLKRARDLADPTKSAHAARIVSEAALLARAASTSLPHAPSDPTALAVLQYTGGTSGAPKAVMLTHANLTTNVAQLLSWSGATVTPGQERLLGVVPLFHIFGLTGVLLFGVASASEITLLPRFDVDRLVETIREVEPTLLPGVPSLFQTLLDHPAAARLDLSHLTLALSGGGPLPPETAARFAARAKDALVNAYGLAEASPAVACGRLDIASRGGVVGPPLAGTSIAIRDPNRPMLDAPRGAVGEIWVKGPQVASGYWNAPPVLVDGWLRTGDLGRLDAAGDLVVVDRDVDVIVRAGFRIVPRVIEDALYAHPAVAEAIVVGVPDASAGAVPVGCVTLRPGQTATSAELLAAITPHLAKPEHPIRIEVRDALPKTVIGKLSRHAVRLDLQAQLRDLAS